MEKIFKTIYEEVFCNEEDIRHMNKNIENEVLRILKKCEHQPDSNNNEEEFLDLLDFAASFAAYQDFCLGMKYAAKGMFTLLK